MHHFLVRLGSDNLLIYFTIFWELTIAFVWLKKSFISAKDTHISNIFAFYMHFSGDSPCADIIVSFWDMWVKTQDI